VISTHAGNGDAADEPWRRQREGGGVAVEMLAQKNVESVLFREKNVAEQTNAEKLECRSRAQQGARPPPD
jgi:hypothetical protein